MKEVQIASQEIKKEKKIKKDKLLNLEQTKKLCCSDVPSFVFFVLVLMDLKEKTKIRSTGKMEKPIWKVYFHVIYKQEKSSYAMKICDIYISYIFPIQKKLSYH